MWSTNQINVYEILSERKLYFMELFFETGTSIGYIYIYSKLNKNFKNLKTKNIFIYRIWTLDIFFRKHNNN